MASVRRDAIVALHRYFIWADEMRRSFEKTIQENAPIPPAWDSEGSIRPIMHMCLWYGLLYVVVEGWVSHRLSDSAVDSLLATKTGRMVKVQRERGTEDVAETYSDLLRKVRNTVFHYQSEYLDQRLIDFMEKQESVAWVRSLHAHFSRWFLNWLDSQKQSTT